jgi:hypothetical protein
VYIDKAVNVLKFSSFIFLFFAIILTGYSKIQLNENLNEVSILKPICFLFLGEELSERHGTCGSISAAKNTYVEKIDTLKSSQAGEVSEMIEAAYSLDNFLFTSDI